MCVCVGLGGGGGGGGGGDDICGSLILFAWLLSSQYQRY